jgi:uncharacterized membrane protein
VRLLATSAEPIANSSGGEILFPKVHVPTISKEDLFDDIFTGLARDGAPLVEVGLRLQKGLRTLAQLGDEEYARLALRHSAAALKRAEAALSFEEDKATLASVAIAAGCKPPTGALSLGS